MSLRDRNLTIHLSVGVGSWVGADELVDGTRVRLDGVDVPLKVRDFPSHEAIVEAVAGGAIESDLSGHHHSRLLPVTLESASSGLLGGALEVQFPRELGPVLVTFVQPKTHQLGAGATALFDVVEDARGGGPDEGSEQSGSLWLLALVAAASIGVGVTAMRRGARRRTRC